MQIDTVSANASIRKIRRFWRDNWAAISLAPVFSGAEVDLKVYSFRMPVGTRGHG